MTHFGINYEPCGQATPDLAKKYFPAHALTCCPAGVQHEHILIIYPNPVGVITFTLDCTSIF